MPKIAKDTRIWSDVVHLMPLWAWETDSDYRLTYINMQFSGMHDVDADKLLGLNILNGAPDPGDREAGLKAYLAALIDQKAITNMCYERLLVNGERVVLMDSALPKWDAQGYFQGYRGVSLNLTEVFRQADVSDSLVASLVSRTEALESTLSHQVAEAEAKGKLLTEVVDAMGEGLMVTSGTEATDPDNHIIMINPAYRALFSLDEDDIAPNMRVLDYLDLLSKRGDVAQTRDKQLDVNEALSRGERVMMDMPRSGRCFYTHATERPSGGYVLVHTDVTELQRQNDALRDARDAADVANRTKSTFLATMSHEIRTPMNGVVGMADLLSETVLTKEQSEYVETIRNSAEALTKLITDILDFSKVEAGRMDLVQEPYELHALIEESMDLLSPLAKGKGLELTFSIDTRVPQVVSGDGLRLRQVILNIVGNAIKFTNFGFVRLSVTVDDQLCINIEDSGIGIPQDRLPFVFKAFEQATTGRDRAFEGTGLGLAITKKLVVAMGGDITVQSQEGQGSLFTLSMPYNIPDVTRAKIEPESKQQIALDGCRVLLVEDNKTNVLVARKMLERRNMEVTVAYNGHDAISLYQPDLFDVVLMDLSMPVMTGMDATRHIRSREMRNGWPHRPIIALTGNAFKKDRSDALAAGMDAFLTKPVRRDMLLSTISDQIARSSHRAMRQSSAVGPTMSPFPARWN